MSPSKKNITRFFQRFGIYIILFGVSFAFFTGIGLLNDFKYMVSHDELNQTFDIKEIEENLNITLRFTTSYRNAENFMNDNSVFARSGDLFIWIKVINATGQIVTKMNWTFIISLTYKLADSASFYDKQFTLNLTYLPELQVLFDSIPIESYARLRGVRWDKSIWSSIYETHFSGINGISWNTNRSMFGDGIAMILIWLGLPQLVLLTIQLVRHKRQSNRLIQEIVNKVNQNGSPGMKVEEIETLLKKHAQLTDLISKQETHRGDSP